VKSKARLDPFMIIHTAADLADEVGLDQISLAAIAARLGVKTPSLYNHIESLAELKKYLAVFGLNEIKTRIARAAIGKSKDDAVMAVIDGYREFAEKRPGLYEATIRSSDPDFPARRAALDSLMEILMKVIEPYGLSFEDSCHQIRILRCMVHGFIALNAAGSFGNKLIDPEITFERMIKDFLHRNQILAQSPNDLGAES
jgi:AcrR family transcriptional regulator